MGYLNIFISILVFSFLDSFEEKFFIVKCYIFLSLTHVLRVTIVVYLIRYVFIIVLP